MKSTDISSHQSAVAASAVIRSPAASARIPSSIGHSPAQGDVASEQAASVGVPPHQLVHIREAHKKLAKECLQKHKQTKTGSVKRLREYISKLGSDHKEVKSTKAVKLCDDFEAAYVKLNIEGAASAVDDWTVDDVGAKRQELSTTMKEVAICLEGVCSCITALKVLNEKQRQKKSIDTRRSRLEKQKLTKEWASVGVGVGLCDWLREAVVCIAADQGDENDDVKAHRLKHLDTTFDWTQPCVVGSDAGKNDASPQKFNNVIDGLSKERIDSTADTLKKFIGSTNEKRGDSLDTRMGLMRMGPAKGKTFELDATTMAPDNTHGIIMEEVETLGAPWMYAAFAHSLRSGSRVDPMPGLPCAVVGTHGKTLVGLISVSDAIANELNPHSLLADLNGWDLEQASNFLNKNVAWALVEPQTVLYVPMGYIPFYVTLDDGFSAIVKTVLFSSKLCSLFDAKQQEACLSQSTDFLSTCASDFVAKHGSAFKAWVANALPKAKASKKKAAGE
jgi:hypothetical protein